MAVFDIFKKDKPVKRELYTNSTFSTSGVDIDLIDKLVKAGKGKKLSVIKDKSLIVNRAIQTVMDDVAASWKPKFVDDNGEEVENKEEMLFLNNPFEFYTKNDLIKQFSRQRRLSGIALCEVIGDKARFLDFGIYSSINFNEDGTLKSLSVRNTEEERPVDDIAVHIDATKLPGWSVGSIPITDARDDILLQLIIEKNINNLYVYKSVRMAAPMHLLKISHDMPVEEIEALKKQIKDKRFEIGDLTVLTEAELTQINDEKLPKEYLDLYLQTKSEILYALGLPKEIFELSGNVSGILYEAVFQNYYRSVVENDIMAFTEYYNNDLRGKLGFTHPSQLSYDDPFPISEEKRRDILRQDYEINAISLEEYREGIGRGDIDPSHTFANGA